MLLPGYKAGMSNVGNIKYDVQFACHATVELSLNSIALGSTHEKRHI